MNGKLGGSSQLELTEDVRTVFPDREVSNTQDGSDLTAVQSLTYQGDDFPLTGRKLPWWYWIHRAFQR